MVGSRTVIEDYDGVVVFFRPLPQVLLRILDCLFLIACSLAITHIKSIGNLGERPKSKKNGFG